MTIKKSINPYGASDIINGYYLEECYLSTGKKGYYIRREHGNYGGLPVYGQYEDIIIRRVYKDYRRAMADLLTMASMQ